MIKAVYFGVRSLVWAVTIAIFLMCLVTFRLFIAPLDLGFAQKTIASNVGEILPGWQMNYRAAEAAWDWVGVRPRVEIKDVRLIDRRNRLNAEISDIDIALGRSTLVGAVSLADVQITGARVVITDIAAFSNANDDGTLGDLFGESGIPSPRLVQPIAEAFTRFSRRLLRTTADLNEITFDNTEIYIERGPDIDPARMMLPRFALSIDGEQVSVQSGITVDMAGDVIQIGLEGNAQPIDGTLHVGLNVDDLVPSQLAEQFELPQPFSYVQVPMDVQVELIANDQVGLSGASFWIDIGQGVMFAPPAIEVPAPVAYGTIAAHWEPDAELFSFDQIEVSTGTRVISGDGFVYWQDGYDAPGIKFSLGVDEVSIDEITAYWPQRYREDGSPRGGRAWVKPNMIRGFARNVEFDVDLDPAGNGAYEDNSPLQLTFDVVDIDTRYVKTMVPLYGAYGRGLLTTKKLDIQVDRATTGGLPLRDSRVLLTDLNIKGGAQGRFDINVSGPVPRILELIDTKPVDISKKMAIALDRIDGEANVSATVRLPLIKKPPVEKVLYDVVAEVTNGSVDDILGGEGIRRADVTLVLDRNKLTATGSAALNGAFFDQAEWVEDFAVGRESATADTTFISASGLIDETDLQGLNVDISDYLSGKAKASAEFQGRRFKFHTGTFKADASDAVLSIPQIGWQKEAGRQVTVSGKMKLAPGGQVSIEPLTLIGDNIDANAEFKWTGIPETPSRTFVTKLNAKQLDDNALSATIRRVGAGPFVADLKGESLDIRPLLRENDNKTNRSGEDKSGDVDLSVNVAQLLMLNGEKLENLDLDVSFRNGSPVMVQGQGYVSGDQGLATISIEDTPDDAGNRPMTVTAQSGGALVRGLGFFAHLNGGNLTLDGTTRGWGKTMVVDAVAKAGDATLVAGKDLIATIEKGQIEGLDKYLADGAMELDQLEMPFVLDKGLLDISSMKANGNTMGMTMEGQIETTEGKINVNGVIVPAYGLNALLGKIPILGTILTGGDGKGVFGFAYRVKGMVRKPDVSFNALSGLAPGFLRLIFEGSKGKVSDVETEPTPAEAMHMPPQEGEPDTEKATAKEPQPITEPDGDPDS